MWAGERVDCSAAWKGESSVHWSVKKRAVSSVGATVLEKAASKASYWVDQRAFWWARRREIY